MNFDHTLLSKNTSNSQLLTLLTKRQAKSLTNLKSDWPGKHAPSLVNIDPKKAVHRQIKEPSKPPSSENQSVRNSTQTKSLQTTRRQKKISFVEANSQSMSLKPPQKTTYISMRNTWRTTAGKKMGETGSSGKNSPSRYNSETETKFRNNKIISIINTPPASAKRQVLEVLRDHPQPSPKTIVNNYIVDYAAFNFLDKVIDDPEKWVKFVHKKTNLGIKK